MCPKVAHYLDKVAPRYGLLAFPEVPTSVFWCSRRAEHEWPLVDPRLGADITSCTNGSGSNPEVPKHLEMEYAGVIIIM